MPFIRENLATLVICALLAGVVALIIAKMISDRRKGKSACGGGCAGCPYGGRCGKKETE